LKIKYTKEEIFNLIKSKKVKPIGIRRDIDELGRLVIPKEYRDIMQTKSFEILLGETDGGEKILILQKAKQR
jgi:bifunctional DNA-binding transcriptional regulator/antitoxin component of YhaV-PrlF toxin-antitoxin module